MSNQNIDENYQKQFKMPIQNTFGNASLTFRIC